jgi:hypothetical protein
LLNQILSAVPWPLPVRPSLDNLADPAMRRLVATALMVLGFAVLLLSLAGMLRQGRVVAVLAALGLVFYGAPSLGLVFVPATPASYRP